MKPSYKSTSEKFNASYTLSLSVNVTETYVDAYELFTRLVWEYIHSSIHYDTATSVMHHSTLERGNAYMLINSTLHKHTLCTHWTGQNHLSPNITPIECHYRTMYSSCSEKENTYVLAYWIASTVSNRHQIKRNRKTRGSSCSEKGNCNILYIAIDCCITPPPQLCINAIIRHMVLPAVRRGNSSQMIIAKLHTYILHIGETSVMHHHAPLTPL